MKTYKDLGIEVGELVDKKQKAYGNSFSKGADILKILYPDGVNPKEYTDMLSMIRIIDKLFRIATQKEAFGESPYRDIAGYGLLGVMKDIEKETCNKVSATFMK
uniref:Uncharacterized protein n=1 Tax=viral metagenome TaxID=1070528 RepID=A0A6M3XQJ2_9ZZZZ